MIITFRELGLEPCPSDYTRAWVINKACDYIMQHFFPHESEHDVIFEPERATVSYAAKMVVIRTRGYTRH